MRPIDFLKAAGVGLAVLVLTLALSYPMVAFYADTSSSLATRSSSTSRRPSG